jgi:AraC family transcriptional regulator
MELEEPRIVQVESAQFIGIKVNTSLLESRVRELWGSFMPMAKKVNYRMRDEFYSFKVYPDRAYFEKFEPERTFQRWESVKVSDTSSMPKVMEKLSLELGCYAVFAFRGKASAVSETYQYICTTWLTQSGYMLANRPHLCRIGSNYKGETDHSEEDIYIPISR